MAASPVCRLIRQNEAHTLQGELLSINLNHMQFRKVHLPKRDDCTVCGGNSRRGAELFHQPAGGIEFWVQLQSLLAQVRRRLLVPAIGQA